MTDTITLTNSVRDQILNHAREDHPIEACGVLIARDDDPHTARWAVRMHNVEQSETCFRFDPTAQLAVWQEAEDDGKHVIAVYHSHTGSDAYPSGVDIAYAADPDVRHLIVSTSPGADGPQLRAFRITDGTVTEQNITYRPRPQRHPTGVAQ